MQLYFHSAVSLKLDVSTDDALDTVERLQIISTFIETVLIPVAEEEFAERSNVQMNITSLEPYAPSFVKAKKVEKRSRQHQQLSAEKK